MNYLDKPKYLSLNERSSRETTNDSIRFIHASDIHLGSHQYENSSRSDDYIFALKEILQVALDYSVDFVLLGGDVFNSLDMLPGKMTIIIEILRSGLFMFRVYKTQRYNYKLY